VSIHCWQKVACPYSSNTWHITANSTRCWFTSCYNSDWSCCVASGRDWWSRIVIDVVQFVFLSALPIPFRISSNWQCYFSVKSVDFPYLRFPSLQVGTCVFRTCVFQICVTVLAFSILTYSIPGTYVFRTCIFSLPDIDNDQRLLILPTPPVFGTQFVVTPLEFHWHQWCETTTVFLGHTVYLTTVRTQL